MIANNSSQTPFEISNPTVPEVALEIEKASSINFSLYYSLQAS